MTSITAPTPDHSPSVGAARRSAWQGHLQAMPDALRSEWIKLASVRSNRVLLALTAVIGAIAAFATAKLVTDEGPGVAQCDRERVFDAFYRSAGARAEGVRGHGVGLALAAGARRFLRPTPG